MIRPEFTPPIIETTRNGGEGPALKLDQPSDGLLFSRTLFTGSGREIVVGYKGATTRGLRFSECKFDGQLGADGKFDVKWGARLYEIVGASFVRCLFEDIPLEHGIYANVADGLLVSGCAFRRIGAQAVQTVWRATETTHPELVNPRSLICVEDSTIIATGKASGAGRAAFALSFHPGPGHVRVQRCAMRSHQPPFKWSGGTANSYGAIMAEGHPAVDIQDVWIEYERPDRPIIQVVDCADVALERIHVSLPAVVRIKNAKRLRVEGCTGAALLEVNGKKLPGAWAGGYVG